MTEESTMGTNLSRKATLLLAEVLAMGNRVLPLSVAGKIQVSVRRPSQFTARAHS
jgi:rapamycin-insensitive companion of mTOR